METKHVMVEGARVVGSHLHHAPRGDGLPGSLRPLSLRIYIDHSLLEVFTCSGAAAVGCGTVSTVLLAPGLGKHTMECL